MTQEILTAIENTYNSTIMAMETQETWIIGTIINKIKGTDQLIIAGICITIILGAAILWNQRKIKKMLRQIQEQNTNEKKDQ